jgi:hypothetical protein
MRRLIGTIVMMALAAVVLAFVLNQIGIRVGGDSVAGSTFNPEIRPLGEIGPRECWTKDTRPSGGTNVGFAAKDGPARAADWLRKPENKPNAEAYDTWLTTYKDYHEVDRLVPNWKDLSRVERVATYVSKMEARQLTKTMIVQNTHCKANGKVKKWQIQILPVGEWVFFIPGTKDKVAFKAVCGNPVMLAARPPSASPGPSTPPPSEPCKSGCVTTPPKCETGCKTTPPPNDAKKPNEAPEGGTGTDRHKTDGPPAPPKAGDPPAQRDNPEPPSAPRPPKDSTPTSHAPPPPEPVAPTNGAPNTGKPPKPV